LVALLQAGLVTEKPMAKNGAKPDELIDEFPEPVRDSLAQIWADVPLDRRQEMQGILGQLPGSLDPLKRILDFVLEQYKPVFGTKQRIAIVGPANVGKSTLYNQLVTSKEDRAEVGPVPGTTRQNQEADTGLFILVDTPGADAVGEVGDRERQIALEAAQAADFLVIMFEATRGIKRHERELFDLLRAPNKMDLVDKRERQLVHESAAQNLHLEPAQVIDTVAVSGSHVEKVVLAVVKFEPELLAAIADAMPHYRSKLTWQRIVPAASAAGVVGLIPLPLIDLLPLLGIQTGLVLSIARIYGFKITAARAKELIATFGVGMIARTVYQQLSKVLGVPGWVLSASIAAATTVVIGYAAMLWFSRGERPTRQAMQRMVTDLTVHLRDSLLGLGRKRPDRVTLRERISQALQSLPDRERAVLEGEEAPQPAE
jgi:small GTP-binding protein